MTREAARLGAFGSPISRPAAGYDWILVGLAGLLFAFGMAALYSIDHARGTSFAPRQALFAAVGTPLTLILSRIQPERWVSMSNWLYGLNLLLLGSVFLIGKSTNAATRWIDIGPLQFQPSEVGKVLLILTLSGFYVKHSELGQLALFFRSLLHVAPFVLLVLLQPHLAGATSLLTIWLAVSMTAGLSWRIVGAAAALVAVLGAAAWLTPGVIRPYMRDRIEAMVRPDSQAGSYQQDQALIALGVGGATGVGYLQGERKASGYIPEQQNDFVFSAIGEEGGLVACAMLIVGFLAFFARVWHVGHRSEHRFGRMAAAGVLAVLGFHVVVNLGMNLGVLPVAGLWLPFVSYGGTALWMCMACLGILLSQR